MTTMLTPITYEAPPSAAELEEKARHAKAMEFGERTETARKIHEKREWERKYGESAESRVWRKNREEEENKKAQQKRRLILEERNYFIMRGMFLGAVIGGGSALWSFVVSHGWKIFQGWSGLFYGVGVILAGVVGAKFGYAVIFIGRIEEARELTTWRELFGDREVSEADCEYFAMWGGLLGTVIGIGTRLWFLDHGWKILQNWNGLIFAGAVGACVGSVVARSLYQAFGHSPLPPFK